MNNAIDLSLDLKAILEEAERDFKIPGISWRFFEGKYLGSDGVFANVKEDDLLVLYCTEEYKKIENMKFSLQDSQDIED